MKYTVVEKVIVLNTFPIVAESGGEALAKYEEMKNAGELDYSDGEPVETEVYVQGEPWFHS